VGEADKSPPEAVFQTVVQCRLRRGWCAIALAGQFTGVDPDQVAEAVAHDLLQAYAVERLAEMSDAERDAAVARVLAYYTHAAAKAMDAVFPTERHRRPRVPHTAGPSRPCRIPLRLEPG
jgi:hypothetical protein